MPHSQYEAPELIWLHPEHSGRGPRPAHSRASIAAAAVRIADAEGIEAVSMRRVAAELGAGTMSLYNYVPKKEHLFDLMIDQVAGEYDLPAGPSGDWRADLTALASMQLAVLRRHAWVPRLVATRPAIGPNGLRYTEFFLSAVAGTELSGAAKMEAMAQLNGFLCQFAEWERAATGSSPRWMADMVTYLQGVAMSGRYPSLTQVLAEGSTPADPNAVFDRLLQRILTALCEA
ncbi:TetR/AcrR family transcriptional regulator C-terminal domain-containing protein [Kitasatospora sp. GP82]|uniref:TetR/AcrR family transcriptional regulator n=1 Tax=Kitasatospora sp. GP82 TaxID=3035089 RepID=UPI002473C61B|nr:TetR/AcrR family transcriptional regulator C-terminal domain-containing protein [Kitasatospora sp. GP82]MDH6124863.1 AcrR family transcriptional regulator [Kitasatospora sp. GP82]